MLIIAFICGILVTYLFQLLDLGMNCLSNKQVLASAYTQHEIDSMNPQNGEAEELRSCIGFHCDSPEDEEFDNEEDE